MLKITDKRKPHLEDGMVIIEHINGQFSRQFVYLHHNEQDFNHEGKDVEWFINDKIDYPYAMEFFRNIDFVNQR